jgi:Spy/CpxP family protein refolding chaperone
MMDRPWKLVLLLAGIFAAGAVTGGFVTVRFGRQMMRDRPRFDQWGPNRIKMLAERLDLTPDQVEKLRPIMRRDGDDLTRIRSTSISDTRRILERMEHDIAEVLTPEQRTKFEQMNREQHERMQRIMKERGPGGGQRHGPDEPPPGPPPDKPADKPPGS